LRVDRLIVVVFCFSRLIVEGFVVVLFFLNLFSSKTKATLRQNVASSTGIQYGGASTIKVDCFSFAIAVTIRKKTRPPCRMQ